MAVNPQTKKKVKELVDAGLKQGYLTQDEILETFPEIEEDMKLLEYVVIQLQEAEVEIIESEVDEHEDIVTKKAGTSLLSRRYRFLKKYALMSVQILLELICMK